MNSRKCILHQLLEHVRLPLISENYIFQNVLNEPLFNNCSECKFFSLNKCVSNSNEFIFHVFIAGKCKDYIFAALRFHFLKRNQSDQVIDTPECIRYKPRQPNSLLKVYCLYNLSLFQIFYRFILTGYFSGWWVWE